MTKPKLWLCICTILVLAATPLVYLHHQKEEHEEREGEEGEEENELEETGADKQLAMWFQARAYPDPYNLNKKYEDAWEQALAMRNSQNNTRVANTNAASWTALGPDETIGGRVLSIAINPSNSNIIFVGTASGGIWKSTTGGTGSKNWKKVSTGFNTLGVSSIIINPSNPNIMYAGTGEVYRIDPANTTAAVNPTTIGFNVWKARGTYGVGILKSVDGGVNWTKAYDKDTPDMFAIEMLKFDPVNPNIIYACATDGLYKSTDAGATWNNILPKIYVTDVAINPSNTNVVVAAVGNLVNTDKGIYRSTNGGTTWGSKIVSALPTSFEGYIRFDNVGSGFLYASIGRVGTGSELYLSTDFGATWIAKSSSDHCGGQYWFGHDLAVDPANANHVIMGGVTYYSYTSTSTTSSTGSATSIASNVHADVHDIKYDPTNSAIVYIANDGGMWKSINSGSTFSNINSGLGATQFYGSIAASPTNPNVIIGGLQDNGVVKYNATTGTWTSLVGGDGGACAFHPNGSTVIYCNDARALYQSTDGGSTETQRLLNCGYGYSTAYDDRTAFIAPIGISKSNPNIMYIASDNLHISTDAGASFSRPNPGTDFTRPIELQYKTAISLAVSPIDANKVYVSTSPFSQRADDALNVNGQPNILRSTNASNNSTYSFTSIKGSLPDRFVMDMAISKFNDDSVYVVLGGFGTSHIYVTPNAGGTWTDIGSGKGLPNVPFNAVLIDPVNPKTIYVGTDYGVYVSPDRGGTWYDYNYGFWDATLVMDLQVSSDNYLLAATHGKGVFKTSLFTGVLPVEITSFTGERENETNKLHWTAEGEAKLRQYEVERSTDGISFSKVGTVAAINQTGTFTYDFNDQVAGSGKFYYRLKCVNNDGSFTYSVVVTLQTVINKPFTVVQNPFHNQLTVSVGLSNSVPVIINLMDSKGRLVKQQRQTGQVGNNTINLTNLDALPRGIYMVEAVLGGERKTKKVMKE